MDELRKSGHWIAGLQWLFFIFANIVIIPITVGEAYQLSQETIVTMLQLAFMVTGLACLAQAFLGHKRPVVEGQSGLWWGIILTLVVTTSAQGMPLEELGGSLAVGILISAFLTVLIGVTGLGPKLAKLFNPSVMGVFMFLFGCTLIQIFLKGMLGIPFGHVEEPTSIDVSVSLLSILIALLVIGFSIKFPAKVRSYALLIGIVIGWAAYTLIFGSTPSVGQSSFDLTFFPLGTPTWNSGVIVTVVLAGLLNTANTFGALKGTDPLMGEVTTKKQYTVSFTITGIFTGLAGLFGLVPYAPYVSSIGFLRQTNIYDRLPFILGSSMFFLMGAIAPIGQFFSTLPLSIGSAVLFVAYLQLFKSSWDFFTQVTFNTTNVYRVAIPLFTGIMIMTFPAVYFESLPRIIQPFSSSGLLVGIILSLFLENLLNWDRIGYSIKTRR
ncbi:uracil/xanthine transporter [Virgibacillus sp. W0181]|uniref:uracil/xanthine transporter n=1 Tax=Virgibacillus sp. W0181 TaxID=3391581 RepID=UPI003F46384B